MERKIKQGVDQQTVTPYLSNPAYIVFSKDFAAHYNTLAKTIISLSTRLDKTAIYNQYKPKNRP